jgi:hypothetical protein
VREVASQRVGELSPSQFTAVIPALVHPAGVMEQAEERDDLRTSARDPGDAKTVLDHPRPADDPVVTPTGST